MRRVYLVLVSYGFSFLRCSEGFLRGFSAVPPSHKATADKCSEVSGLVCCWVCSEDSCSEVEERLIAGFADKVNDYFFVFLEIGEPRMTRML